MKKSFIKLISTVVLLILVTATILSSLTSCLYIAGSKDEINSNINQSVNENPTERSTVAEYLRDWGMPKFDTIKFSYIESCFIQLYNYGEGLPKTKDHAVATANLFVEKYYDTIDHNDKTAVTDALLYCYVEAIGDPYSIYRPPVEADEYEMDMSGKFGGIGVVVQYNHNDESIMIETVYPHSPGEAAGLKVGDIFYSIDGKTVAEIGYLNAVYHIRGKIGSTVEITVIRDGKYVTVTATRDEIEEINVDYEIDESNNIGYVQIVAFKKNTAEQFIEAIDALEEVGVDGIIFDLRGNPGGYVQSVCDVISYLIPSGNLIVSYQYKGRDAVEILSTDNGTDDHVLDLPFVVICDSNTASSGEIFTSAIRDYRNEGLVKATLVGTTTYKKGIMQNTYSYIDNSTVTLTVAYYNPPCGVNYHGIGVSPDVFVENTTDEDLQLVVAKNELLKLISDN